MFLPKIETDRGSKDLYVRRINKIHSNKSKYIISLRNHRQYSKFDSVDDQKTYIDRLCVNNNKIFINKCKNYIKFIYKYKVSFRYSNHVQK